MPPEELIRQMTDIAENAELKKRKALEKKIQRAIISEIAACQKKIQKREEEIRVLKENIQRLSENKSVLRAKIASWQLKRKQRQLEELKRITPSPRSSAVRRMLDER